MSMETRKLLCFVNRKKKENRFKLLNITDKYEGQTKKNLAYIRVEI